MTALKGQDTDPVNQFASIDDTLAKCETQQPQSTQVHKIMMEKEEKAQVKDHKGKADAEQASGLDKMTYAELELECRWLRGVEEK